MSITREQLQNYTKIENLKRGGPPGPGGGYWRELEGAPVEDWQREVAEGETREGYWDWAAAITGVVEL